MLRFAPAAADQASARRLIPRGGRRSTRGRCASQPSCRTGSAPSSSRDARRACYLADDQVEAIAAIQEAIACRRPRRGRPEAGACTDRALAATSAAGVSPPPPRTPSRRQPALVGNETGGEGARLRVRGACVACRGRPRARGDRGVPEARPYGDPAGRGLRRPTKPRSMRSSHRGTAGSDATLAAGRAMLEHAVGSAGVRPNAEQVARALNNVGGFGVQRYDHELANTSWPRRSTNCLEHDAGPVANQRPRPQRAIDAESGSLDRGDRVRDAVAPGSARLAVAAPRGPTRAGARPRSARRSDAREAVDKARRSASPAEELEADHRPRRGRRRDRVGSRVRSGDVERSTDRTPQRPSCAARTKAICRLSFWRAARRVCRWTCPTDRRIRTRSPSQATGTRRQPVAGLGCPYEHRSRCPAPMTRPRSVDRSPGSAARRPAGRDDGHAPPAGTGARDVPSGPRESTRSNAAGAHGPRTRRASPARRRAAERRDRRAALPLACTVDHHVSAILRNSASSGAARLRPRPGASACRRPVARARI